MAFSVAEVEAAVRTNTVPRVVEYMVLTAVRALEVAVSPVPTPLPDVRVAVPPNSSPQVCEVVPALVSATTHSK